MKDFVSKSRIQIGQNTKRKVGDPVITEVYVITTSMNIQLLKNNICTRNWSQDDLRQI